MKILFFSSNTNQLDSENFCFSFYPTCKDNFEILAEKYPDFSFVVVTQKPGVFLVDLENGELNEEAKAKNLEYHILQENISNEDFAAFIKNLGPDYAISMSYWLAPLDWLSLNDSLIAENLKQQNIKTICHSLENQEICFNKWDTQLALEAKGFEPPKSIYVSHDLFWAERSNKSIIKNPYKELIFTKLKNMTFPVVIKSLTGFSSYGMDVAKTFPEALHFLNQKSGNEDKIIQEYKDGLHFGLEIYGDQENFEVLPPFLFTVNKYGITSPKQSIKIGPFNFDNEKYQEKLQLSSLKNDMERLWKTFGFSGSIQVDLVFAENKWHIIEINPRLSGMTFTYSGLKNSNPQELMLKSLVDKTIFPKNQNIKLCNLKIPVQSKSDFEKLTKNPMIKRIFQIDNKLAKQKRDVGFCEIVFEAQNYGELSKVLELPTLPSENTFFQDFLAK